MSNAIPEPASLPPDPGFVPALSTTPVDPAREAGAMPFPLSAAMAVAVASGGLLALPFTWFESSSTVWFALAPIFWLAVKAPTARQAAWLGALFFLAWTNICFSFLWNVAFVGAIASAAYTSLYYIAAMLLVRRMARWGPANAVIGTASLWVLIEIARSVVPVLAFPWMLLGHALARHDHLRQAADLFGVYGLSFMVAGINACIAFMLPRALPVKWRALPAISAKSAWNTSWLFVLLGLGAAWFYGELRIERLAPRLQAGDAIAVIQGNIAEKLGRTEEQLHQQIGRHVELHREIVARAHAEHASPVLVCWAETMVPGFIGQSAYGDEFKQAVRDCGVMTLAGANHRLPPLAGGADEEYRDHNAAMVFDGEGREVLAYFKRRLVPFGEYIPFAERWHFLRMLRSVTRDQYLPGTDPTPVFKAGNYRIGLNLCVEDIHPDLAREAAWRGADAIVNLTNDGWFYGTFGPLAHMRAALWRAIEVRRPLLRVTNTGRTVAVDPLGEVTLLIPNETEGTALVRLKRITSRSSAMAGQAAGNERTSAEMGTLSGPVTLYMRMGESGVFALAALILWMCWYFAARPF